MDTRFEILFKLLPLLDSSTAALPEVKSDWLIHMGAVQSEISVKIFKAKSKLILR